MKIKFLALLILLLFTTISFSQSSIVVTPDWGVSLKITSNEYIITYRPSNFRIEIDSLSDYSDDNNYGPFSYLDFYYDIYDYLEDSGRPELPFYSMSLHIPNMSSVATITNIKPYFSDSSYFYLPYSYVPCQNRLETSNDNTLYFDTVFYDSNNEIKPYAYLSPKYSFVGTIGIDLTINPFMYNPIHNEIIIPDSIQIIINVSNANLLNMINDFVSKDSFHDAYLFYDTYSGLDYNNNESYGDYIILTENQYRDDLDTFIQHKTDLGYNVIMYDLETEGLTKSSEIRSFLYNLYQNNSDIRFLLLVGSLNKIPTSAGVQNDYNNPPTDIYYACLEDSIISNEGNLYPEIYVGRWLVNNERELYFTMQKTIKNENEFRYNTLCHSELFSGKGKGEKKFNKNVKWISNKVLSVMNYPHAYHLGNSGLNAKSMKDIIAHDTTWLFYYRGHGGIYSYGSPYDLNVSSFPNNSYSYLGFAFACDMGNVYYNCFAKNWLCSENKGGPFYYASTTESYRSCNNNQSKRIFKMLKKDFNMHIAQMIVCGNNKYYGGLSTSSYRRNQIKKYVLFGDPSLLIWGQESSIPYRMPQNNISPFSSDDNSVEYVYDINGKLIGIGSGFDIIQNAPMGIYIIYNSKDNTCLKILK